MQAITTGAMRPHPAPLRLPSFPVPADLTFQFPDSDLDYIATLNGVLVTFSGLLVAWIYPGHAGSRDGNRCLFWDVAHPALTTGEQGRVTGIMLASESFDSLPEAVQHVEATFGGAT
ncbi:MAG: hypothetical protein KDI44_12880 [Thiothrix sp.]|nr:hypothetical protein [Thiothrix sp.]